MIYELSSDDFIFPNPQNANESGLVAYGGDYEAKRLINAYKSGIFPWPHANLPPLWFSPDPRAVLEPQNLHLTRSFKRSIKRYEIRFDSDFAAVIEHCAHRRATWINADIIASYKKLHALGFAHSVESYDDMGVLVGGLYGVEVGNIFCGESMFSLSPDSSKAALYALCQKVKTKNGFIDCQVMNDHLRFLGAREIERSEFLRRLKSALEKPSIFGI